MTIVSKTNDQIYLNGDLPDFLLGWTQQVGMSVVTKSDASPYYLEYKRNKLHLIWQGQERFSSVCVEPLSYQRVQASNLLLKALGKKFDTVVDLTAGFGIDAMTIAATGRRVYCIERCAPIALMLYDGLVRCPARLRDKLNLNFANSHDWLKNNSEKYDLLYMDTMFKKKKTAAKSNKVMQIFRQIAGDDIDAQQLYQVALKSRNGRLLVKRANDAMQIGKTVAQYQGKTVRFDLYNCAM